MPSARLRLTEIPHYIGPCVITAGKHAGEVDVVPQECDCKIMPGLVAGLYDIELCPKHQSLAKTS